MQIELGGTRVSYELSGRKSGATVVLSHSLGSSLRMWDFQLGALEGSYRVLRYDTRGHGGSEATPGAYTLDQLGDDACRLLDHLGLDAVHWVGLSMGGMIGQNIALRYPGRFATCTLCDTSAIVPEAAHELWDERIAAVEDGGIGVLTQSTMERWFTAPYLAAEPPGVALIREEFDKTPAAGFIGCCHAIRALDYIDRLSEIGIPALIIVGEDDPGTPVAASQAMHERIRGSRLVVIPEAAHLSNVEQTDRFNEAMTAFLAEHAAA